MGIRDVRLCKMLKKEFKILLLFFFLNFRPNSLGKHLIDSSVMEVHQVIKIPIKIRVSNQCSI